MIVDRVHLNAPARVSSVEERPKTWLVGLEFLEPAAGLVEREGEPIGVEEIRGPVQVELVRAAFRRRPRLGEVVRLGFVVERERFGHAS